MELLWIPFPRYAGEDPALPSNYNWTVAVGLGRIVESY